MSTLPDRDIPAFQALKYPNSRLIHPYDPAQQNPASYDVRLSPIILVELHPYQAYCNQAIESAESNRPFRNPFDEMEDRQRWKRFDMRHGPGYWLEPGEFILGSTVEHINVPLTMECIFQLKSSPARAGLNHLLAAYIDPGYSGHITLELYNTSRYYSLRLDPNMLIGQLRFSILSDCPKQSYRTTGHYNGDVEPQPSRIPYKLRPYVEPE